MSDCIAAINSGLCLCIPFSVTSDGTFNLSLWAVATGAGTIYVDGGGTELHVSDIGPVRGVQ